MLSTKRSAARKAGSVCAGENLLHLSGMRRRTVLPVSVSVIVVSSQLQTGLGHYSET